MPTKRTRRARSGNTLSDFDKAALVVGTGWNHLEADEIERLRQVWHDHGDRLVKEHSEPWGMLAFGQP